MGNFQRIQKGMSGKQVEAIIGKPRRESSTFYGTMIGRGPRYGYQEEWVSRLGKIVIHFDRQDLVVHARFLENPEPGWLDRALINLDKFMTR
jgi:hypothetical protein